MTTMALPCSTASVSALPAATSESTLHQLDQIERQRANALNGSSAHDTNGKTFLYHPVFILGSHSQSSINFTYHAPVPG
jgi:hypothetical protein